MKEGKEPIRPITWVIVGIAVIFIAGSFVYYLYSGYQQRKVASEEINRKQQELLSEQQKQLEQAKKEIEDLTSAQKIPQEKVDVNNNPTIQRIVPETNPQIKIELCKTESSKDADAMAKYEASLGVKNFTDGVKQQGTLDTGNPKVFQMYLEMIKSTSDRIYSQRYDYYYQTLYASCLNK